MNRRAFALSSLAVLSACKTPNVVSASGGTSPLPPSVPLTPSALQTFANGTTSPFKLRAMPGGVGAPFPLDNAGQRTSLDYVFTTAAYDLTDAQSFTADIQIDASPDVVWQYLFDGNSDQMGFGPAIRLILVVPGPMMQGYLTLPYKRWYGPRSKLASGSFTTSLADPSLWTDVNGETNTIEFANAKTRACAGFCFGGGFSAGHGVAVSAGSASFKLTKLGA